MKLEIIFDKEHSNDIKYNLFDKYFESIVDEIREDLKEEIASNLIKSGMSTKFVSENVDLPLEVVEDLS